jgi:nucleoside-diphosphate-sugar epimerase
MANVSHSFENPSGVINNNINITLILLEAVRTLKDLCGYNPIIQICSTSEVYGNPTPENIPINENCPLAPINPYAVSKLAQDSLSYVYFLNYGLNIIRTRMFSYFNAKRPNLFATNFAKQIIEIRQERKDVLKHGNLSSIRTMIDVRDAAQSYWIAATKGKVGEVYNIGGTEPVSVGEVLEKLIEVGNYPITRELDKTLLRPSDVSIQVPDVSKFFLETGWKPQYNLKSSLEFFWKEANEFWT